MTPADVVIRPASLADSADLLAWRNDATTRAMSFDSKLVSLDEHQKWLSRSLESSQRYILIGEYVSQKVGMCRFDIEPDGLSAEISINVNPALRGRSLASPLLQNSIAYFVANHAIRITARTKISNGASRRIFQKAGFKVQETVEGIMHWQLCV